LQGELHYKLVDFGSKAPKNKSWKECEYLTIAENREEIWTSTDNIIPGQKPASAPDENPGAIVLHYNI
jgi:hypothetical protein